MNDRNITANQNNYEQKKNMLCSTEEAKHSSLEEHEDE